MTAQIGIIDPDSSVHQVIKKILTDATYQCDSYSNPEDALKRGIRNDDIVKIFNDRGKIEINACLDLGIKPGCICVTNGWWISEGGTVNFCSVGRETDIGYGAAFHDTLVEVKKI